MSDSNAQMETGTGYIIDNIPYHSLSIYL